jgi:SAM-dependent methyltransferase
VPDRDPIEEAAARYGALGRLDRGFVRGKLRGDPVYRALAFGGLLPERGVLLDLGCGRGILLAALRAAGSGLRLVGIESGRAAEVARRALGREAEIVRADLRDAVLPACDAAILLDVLHYLDRTAQEDLVDRTASVLRPGGVLVVREADAGGGPRFWSVRVSERTLSCLRGRPFATLRYRSKEEWGALLRATGLEVEARTAGEGTPFANVLFVARKAGGITRPGSASSSRIHR